MHLTVSYASRWGAHFHAAWFPDWRHGIIDSDWWGHDWWAVLVDEDGPPQRFLFYRALIGDETGASR